MSRIITVVIALFAVLLSYETNAQGCVAIRGNASCGANLNANTVNVGKGEFNLLFSYRYFKSFRHFRGDHEEVHRVEEGTEVINNSSFVDFGLSYGISNRLFANAILPFVFHDRSSMYEHGGNPPNGLGERHETISSGISDVRLGIGYWLFEPGKHDFNYSLGIGIKLPTGSYDYTDTFYNQGDNDDQDIDLVVDQSIQPGDGGTGIALDIQGFHMLNHNLSLLTNFFYLINPRETNGVLTRRGTSEFSCPDQYAARLGLNYSSLNGMSAYLGGRIEGVTASDLVGGDAGYRRPGYAVSIEPGFAYAFDRFSLFVSVPLALYRNRVQSYQDKVRTEETGVYRHGDAAFADYLISFSAAYRFGGAHHKMAMDDTGI